MYESEFAEDDVPPLQSVLSIPAWNTRQLNILQWQNMKNIEAANGPTIVEADEILNKKGIVVVPDILSQMQVVP